MSKMSATSRGVLIAACVVTAAALTATAMSTYIYDPIATEFGLDGQQASVMKAIPIMATVLIVFLVGSLGDRLGHRMIITLGAVAFWIGAIITAISPFAWTAILGISVLSIGATAMSVTAIAMLSIAFTTKDDRANAFSTIGVLTPSVFLVAPFIAGVLVTELSWRWVAVVWAVVGLVASILARRVLPPDTRSSQRSELVTPLLAGIALTFGVQITVAISSNGFASVQTLLYSIATVVAFIVLLVVHRKMKDPILSFQPLKNRRSWLLLFVVFTVPILSLWYTAYLTFQYLYGFTAIQISLIMIPAQFAGMIGARLMKPFIGRAGLLTSGLVILLVLTVVQFSYLAIGADTLWLSVVLIAAYGLSTNAFAVASSNAVMNESSSTDAGSMSSYRSASGRVGSAMASLIIGGILFGTYNVALNDQESAAGYTSTTITTSESAPLQTDAMVDALHARAVFAGVLTLVSAGAYTLALRRRRNDKEPQHV